MAASRVVEARGVIDRRGAFALQILSLRQTAPLQLSSVASSVFWIASSLYSCTEIHNASTRTTVNAVHRHAEAGKEGQLIDDLIGAIFGNAEVGAPRAQASVPATSRPKMVPAGYSLNVSAKSRYAPRNVDAITTAPSANAIQPAILLFFLNKYLTMGMPPRKMKRSKSA
jgi:hypothetical protein